MPYITMPIGWALRCDAQGPPVLRDSLAMGPALRCPGTACAEGLACNPPACRDADAKLQTGRRGFEKLGRHVWSWASCLQAVDKHEWLEPGRDSHIAYTFAGDVGDRPFPVGDHTCDTSAPQPGRLLSLADPQLLAAWRVRSRPYFTKHLTHVPGGTCTSPAAAGEWQCTADGCTVVGSDDDANTLAAEPQWCDGHANRGTCEHRHTQLSSPATTAPLLLASDPLATFIGVKAASATWRMICVSTTTLRADTTRTLKGRGMVEARCPLLRKWQRQFGRSRFPLIPCTQMRPRKGERNKEGAPVMGRSCAYPIFSGVTSFSCVCVYQLSGSHIRQLAR